jgi:hypothetical protein
MNGIITLKKHVDVEHSLLAKKFDEEMNNLVKSELERQLVKKKQNVSSSEISNFFIIKILYKKEDVQLKQFLEDLALLIIKSHMPIHFVENPWLKRFTL